MNFDKKLWNGVKSFFTPQAVAVGGGSLVLAGVSHAALGTEVTTAITTAQTDLLALYAALTAAGVAIWVGRLIYRKFIVR